ncbi:MAG: paraquat-inducible protein A [Pseudomonadota bacterium]
MNAVASRDRVSAGVTLAITFAAGICLGVGLFLPSIAFEQFFVFDRTHSLVSAIYALWLDGEVWLATVLALFSFLLPIVKLVLFLTDGTLILIRGTGVPTLSRAADLVGRWSMLDVFVVALVILAIKGSGIASAATLPGIWLFTLAVVLSMWAGERLKRAHMAEARLT